MSVNILVIEDDQLLAMDLVARLEDMGYVVTAYFDSAKGVSAFLEENRVDLMIIDIELGGQRLGGIDLATSLGLKSSLPFLFLTSHTDEAIVAKAREVGPSAYLVKPYANTELQIAIELALSNFANRQNAAQPAPEKADHYVVKSSLFIKKDFRFHRLAVEDILYIEAQSNYTLIVSKREQFLLTVTMKVVEEKLDWPYFMRIHRSYIINLQQVEAFEGNMVFISGKSLPISEPNRTAFLERFNTL